MARQSFFVKACWDDEAKVFYSESNIKGLHIEAKTIEEFGDILNEAAPDLIIANHIDKADLATRSFADLIPSILWQQPNNGLAHA